MAWIEQTGPNAWQVRAKQDGRTIRLSPEPLTSRQAAQVWLEAYEAPIYPTPQINVPTRHGFEQITLGSLASRTITIGAIGDSHLGSKYERLDVLNALYDTFAAEGASVVYLTGNHIDGEARFNKHDIYVHGCHNQIKNFVKQFPQREGIETRFVTGDDHEGWYTQREGIDTGLLTVDEARRAGRADLAYIGHMEANDELSGLRVRVVHPGGGSAKSVSLRAQDLADMYIEDDDCPELVLLGHYHKAHFLPFYRKRWFVQTGTTQEQTPFMRKLRLRADLGGWLLRVTVNEAGKIDRMSAEFLPFQPRPWKYYLAT